VKTLLVLLITDAPLEFYGYTRYTYLWCTRTLHFYNFCIIKCECTFMEADLKEFKAFFCFLNAPLES